MPETAKDWLSAVNLVLVIGAFVYAWLTARAKGNSEHLKAVDAKLIDHDRRIQSAESELAHMPAKEDVMELKVAIAELRGTVGRLDESVSSVSRSVHRVEDYLVKETR